MPSITYRYELRRGEETIATGYVTYDTALEVGQRISIGRSVGTIRRIEPSLDGETRLLVELA